MPLAVIARCRPPGSCRPRRSARSSASAPSSWSRCWRPPGAQSQELSEFGTMCSPSSTVTPSTVLTCGAVSSVQASSGAPCAALAAAASSRARHAAGGLVMTRSIPAASRDILRATSAAKRKSARARDFGPAQRFSFCNCRIAGRAKLCIPLIARGGLDMTLRPARVRPACSTSLRGQSSMFGKLLLCSTPFVLTLSVAAAPPVDNINPHRHPDLAAAQRLATQAYEKVSAAQVANEWDLGGHAPRRRNCSTRSTASSRPPRCRQRRAPPLSAPGPCGPAGRGVPGWS